MGGNRKLIGVTSVYIFFVYAFSTMVLEWIYLATKVRLFFVLSLEVNFVTYHKKVSKKNLYGFLETYAFYFEEVILCKSYRHCQVLYYKYRIRNTLVVNNSKFSLMFIFWSLQTYQLIPFSAFRRSSPCCRCEL